MENIHLASPRYNVAGNVPTDEAVREYVFHTPRVMLSWLELLERYAEEEATDRSPS